MSVLTTVRFGDGVDESVGDVLVRCTFLRLCLVAVDGCDDWQLALMTVDECVDADL
jgi:hypothetical protein